MDELQEKLIQDYRAKIQETREVLKHYSDKLSTTSIDCPLIYEEKTRDLICRGIVTADVLAKGLSRRAIATRKQEGVNWNKGHEVYTGSAPYGEGNSLIQLRVFY